jgi:DUF4097 and DUF4098 domain-containing protein YvlB
MSNGYRKDSIFWALTLIAVGGLFLYTNFHDFRPWHIIAKYWPLLIIFWGLSKLYAYFKYRDDPNVPAGPFISGGEIVGLIFLLLIGTAISGVVRHSSRFSLGPTIHIGDDEDSINLGGLGGLFGNPFDFTEQVEAATKPKPVIELPDLTGDIKITGWDQPKIQVLVKKRIYAESEKEAKDQSEFIKATIADQDGQYRITINRQDALNKGYRFSADLEVNVPKDSHITATERRGNVVMSNLVGDQTADSARGDVEFSSVAGNVIVKMKRGDLKVNDVTGNVDVSGKGNDLTVTKVGGSASVNGEFYSVDLQAIKKQARFISSRTDLTAEKVEGSMRMESGNLTARNVNGLFSLRTKDRDVMLEEVAGPIRIDLNQGNVQYRSSVAPKSDIEVVTQNSPIELALPQNSSFSINGKTKSGYIQSDFKGPGLKITQDQPVNEITGTFGKGGPHFRLETTYGNVKLIQR